MNITLRCQGSKREQARPPICAARRRAHRRASCQGDQTNAALNARVLPNRPHGHSCRRSCFCHPYEAGAVPTRRAADQPGIRNGSSKAGCIHGPRHAYSSDDEGWCPKETEFLSLSTIAIQQSFYRRRVDFEVPRCSIDIDTGVPKQFFNSVFA